jgi:enoyl reductase-like protein
VNKSGAKALVLQSFSSLDALATFVKKFFVTYPVSTAQLLALEDKVYFLAISWRCGQKLDPFIPILDADFEVRFRKVCCAIIMLQHVCTDLPLTIGFFLASGGH